MFSFENIEGNRQQPQRPEVQTSPEEVSEKSKKILRNLSEIGKRLEDVRCGNFIQLFGSAEVVGLRLKIRDQSLRAIQIDLSCAHKALEFTWRKSFYEPIWRAKQINKGRPMSKWAPEEVAYLRNHLTGGIGYYHNLLMVLQLQWKMELRLATPIDFFSPSSSQDPQCGAPQKGNSDQGRSLRKLIHFCLMSLGDLSRYQLDLLQAEEKLYDHQIAQRYYHQAVAVDYQYGLSYNQLATLALNQAYGMQSVFYYLRSMTVKSAFDGAESNLRLFLEKKSALWDRMSSDKDQEQIIEEKVAVLFLKVVYVALFEKNAKKLASVCKGALRCLSDWLDLADHCTSTSKDLSDKMVLILLLMMEKLKENDQQVSLLKAYLLALVTHFLSKVLFDLHFTFFGPESAWEIFQPKSSEDNTIGNDKKNGTAEMKDSNTDSKCKKRHFLSRLRRKKKSTLMAQNWLNQSDSEEGNSDEDNDSDFSLESLEADDKSDLESSNDSSLEDDNESCSKDTVDAEEMLLFLRNHHLTSAVRLFGFWLRSNREVVEQAGPHAETLWLRLCQLVQAVSIQNPKFSCTADLVNAAHKCKEMLFVTSTPEDYLVRGMRTYADRQSSLSWGDCSLLTDSELGLMFVLQLEELCGWLSEMAATNIRKVCLKGKETFSLAGNGSSTTELELTTNYENNEAARECRKEQMMYNMAQLWLQQEVQELEGVTNRSHGGVGHYSPYLVIDHLALINDLNRVKDIVATKKFAIIIPLAVVQELDCLKKTVNGARNAIRWLEKQFEEGNRWLRCQKPNERKTIDLVSYPKKKDKTKWHYFKVLECCIYFSSLRQHTSAMQVVTLITSTENEAAFDCKPPLGLADVLNIKVEDVKMFIEKASIHRKVPQGKSRKSDRNRAKKEVG